MKDIKYNFLTNDIDINDSGDFAIADTCSAQNATFILMKSAADLRAPYIGVGAGERYPHLTLNQMRVIANKARQQVLDDGAAACQIRVTNSDTGDFNFEVAAKYREPSSPTVVSETQAYITNTDYAIIGVNNYTIAASGGSATVEVSGRITYTWSDGTTSYGSFTPTLYVQTVGQGMTYDNGTVTAADRGTTEGDIRQTVVVAESDYARPLYIYVSQAANSVSTVTKDAVLAYPTTVIAASGGTASPTLTYSVTTTYTSGASTTVSSGGDVAYTVVGAGFSIDASSGVITAADRGTTEGAARTATATATVTIGNVIVSATASVTQQLNTVETYVFTSKSLAYNGVIPANGGSISPTLAYVVTSTYTSGATSTTTSGASVAYTISGSGIFLDSSGNGVASAQDRVGIAGDARTSTVQAVLSLFGVSTTTTATVSQAANVATYATPTVTLTVSDIPASGGSVNSGTVHYSQVVSYSSGYETTISDGGSLSYSAAVTAASKGTTASGRTEVGTLTATITMNGMSGNGAATVYQAANVEDFANPSVTLSVNDIPASGGTISSGTVGYSQLVSYTSGATQTLTTGGTVTYGSAVTMASRGTAIGNRIAGSALTATVTMNGKSGSASATVYQVGNYVTLMTIVPNDYSYGTFAAAGETLLPSDTGSTVTFTFSSGDTSTTTPSSTYGTLAVGANWTLENATAAFVINATTGAITAPNNTSTSTQGARVYHDATVQWTPTSGYDAGGIKNAAGSNSATISQSAGVVSYTLTDSTIVGVPNNTFYANGGVSYNPTPNVWTNPAVYKNTIWNGITTTSEWILATGYSYFDAGGSSAVMFTYSEGNYVVLYCGSRGNVPGDILTMGMSLTLDGMEAPLFYAYQEANYPTSLAASPSSATTVSGSGGTVTLGAVATYTSGATAEVGSQLTWDRYSGDADYVVNQNVVTFNHNYTSAPYNIRFHAYYQPIVGSPSVHGITATITQPNVVSTYGNLTLDLTSVWEGTGTYKIALVTTTANKISAYGGNNAVTFTGTQLENWSVFTRGNYYVYNANDVQIGAFALDDTQYNNILNGTSVTITV